jgi:hypothetical protein
MIKLIIDDKDADLLQTEQIITEYRVADIGNISARAGTKSIQFKLPKTANNKAIFDSAHVITSVSDKPYKNIKARLFVDGIDMKMAYCILERVDDYYNIRLYGVNANLYDALKKKKLADLDLNHLNHHWDVHSLAETEDINYPLKYAVVDYNIDSPNDACSNANNHVYLGTLLPCVYENYLIQKVINEAGYSLDNKLLEESIMKEREPLIPLGSRTYKRDTNPHKYIGEFTLPAINTLLGNPQEAVFSIDITRQNEKLFRVLPAYGNDEILELQDDVKIKVRGNIRVKGTSVLAPPLDFSSLVVRLEYSNTTNLYNTYEIANTTIYPTFVDFPFDIEIEVTRGYIPIYGPVSEFRTIVISGYDETFYELEYDLANCWFDIYEAEVLEADVIEYEVPILSGGGLSANFVKGKDYVTVANQLPDFTQADFLKEYLKKFGSIISVDDLAKKVTITPFKSIKDNINLALDWSGKVDFSETPEIEFDLNYAQLNTFKYKDDDDVIKPIGTDKVVSIDNNTLAPEKIVIESKYSATESVERLWFRQIPQIKVFESYEFKKQSKPRCLLMAAELITINYLKTLNTSVGQYPMNLTPFCYFIRDGFNSLGFESNLYDLFYDYIFGVIDKSKSIKCNIRLTTADIVEFDGTKPIYIKEFDSYFYVSSIKFEYTRNAPAECELIKLL